jgi:hypothetical protein
MEYLGTDITIYVRDLYEENCKTLIKDTSQGDLNNWNTQ